MTDPTSAPLPPQTPGSFTAPETGQFVPGTAPAAGPAATGYIPAGFTAPKPAPPAARRGIHALVLAIFALAVPEIIAVVCGTMIGRGMIWPVTAESIESLRFLSPVRVWVLVVELGFWLGTVLGIAALVQGIRAIIARRGRGYGIAATILAVIAPVAFAAALVGSAAVGVTG